MEINYHQANAVCQLFKPCLGGGDTIMRRILIQNFKTGAKIQDEKEHSLLSSPAEIPRNTRAF